MCQGHGTLEESDTSDRPNHLVFKDSLAGAFAGSESSTTSNSRLTPGSDALAYLRSHSSTSSDIPTYSQYGRGRRRRTTSGLFALHRHVIDMVKYLVHY